MADYDSKLTTCPYCGATLTKHGGTTLSKDPHTKDANGDPTIVKADSWKECHNCKQF